MEAHLVDRALGVLDATATSSAVLTYEYAKHSVRGG